LHRRLRGRGQRWRQRAAGGPFGHHVRQAVARAGKDHTSLYLA
jgi:hypothetical protein